MGMCRNVTWCTVRCRLSAFLIVFSPLEQESVGISWWFPVFLDPCICLLLSGRIFISSYKKEHSLELTRMGMIFPSLPSLSPSFQTCHCLTMRQESCPLAPFCTHRYWDQCSSSWTLSLETGFKSCLMALLNSSVLPVKHSWKLRVLFLIFLCQHPTPSIHRWFLALATACILAALPNSQPGTDLRAVLLQPGSYISYLSHFSHNAEEWRLYKTIPKK